MFSTNSIVDRTGSSCRSGRVRDLWQKGIRDLSPPSDIWLNSAKKATRNCLSSRSNRGGARYSNSYHRSYDFTSLFAGFTGMSQMYQQKFLSSSRQRALAIASLLWALASFPVHATKPFGPSASEIKMLPPYCAVKLATAANPESLQMWEQKMGKQNWLHVHHYCFALNFMNRAKFERDPADRRYYLSSAIDNFNYVINNWDPKSQFMPAAKNYRNQAELMLKMTR